jgi:hypothetical protein
LDKFGEHDYIVRSHGNYLMSRSVSTDLELEPGTYSVLMKITAKRFSRLPTPDETIRRNCKTKQEKLVQIGLAYDLAHARGQVEETEEERKKRVEQEEKVKTAAKKKLQEEVRERKYKDWLIKKKEYDRRMRRKSRREAHERKKAGEKKANPRGLEPEKGENRTVPDIDNINTAVKDAAPSVEEQAKVVAPVSLSPPLEEPEQQKLPLTTGALSNGLPQDDAPNHITAQARIDQFNKDLEAVKNNDPAPDIGPHQHRNLSSAAASDDRDDISSVASWCTSVISDLDYSTGEPDTSKPEAYAEDNETLKEDEIDEENLEFANDPWNAVCVVGLRVYSKDSGITVRVVRPKVGEDEEETPLDLDDPSKGISEEIVVGNAEAEEARQLKDGATSATDPQGVFVKSDQRESPEKDP